MSTFNLPYDGSDASTSWLSAWERFLLSAGVPEHRCASLVADGRQEGNAIRSWVLENYARRYVPEHILEVLGLTGKLALRWQREERRGEFPDTARMAGD
jgi:hypothetical protein